MEEVGDGIFSFTTFEEMAEHMERATQAAIAAMTPHQRGLLDGQAFTWFRYYPEMEPGFTIWGQRKSLADLAAEYEAKAKECETRDDPEGAEEWRDEIERDKENLARGYVSGTAYSTVEPGGEYGDTHAASIIGVPAEWFLLAKMHHWSLGEMLHGSEESRHAAELIIEAWNLNLAAQISREMEDKEEGM